MRHFKSELQLDGKHAVITVNYLDNQVIESADVRFEVLCEERRSEILVHEEYYSPPILSTPEDAIAYSEMVNGPDEQVAYSEDDHFTPAEIVAIGDVIYEFKSAFYRIFK